MPERVKQYYQKFKSDLGKMKEQIPDTINGFAGLFSNTMKEGELSAKEKELIALGIAVAVNCEPCIRLHVQKALQAGATKQQILESASVAVMMGGGPAYTHIPAVMDSLEALEE